MRKIILTVLAAALLLPALRTPSSAQPGPDREELEGKEPEVREHPMLSEKFLDTLKEKLKLKDDQFKKVKAAIDESREPLQRKSEDVRDMMKKMRELQKALKGMEFDLREKIRSTLTNEQKERFDEIVVRMREQIRPDRAPFSPRGEMEEKRQFPPERWEDNPDRGRRQREERPATPQKP